MSDRKLIIRLSTNEFRQGDRIVFQKSIRPLKSVSDLELSDLFDGDDLFDQIENIDCCEDGIYELKAVNISTDWQTGYVDDWDLKLLPYEPPKEQER